jgi:hypothetical protein
LLEACSTRCGWLKSDCDIALIVFRIQDLLFFLRELLACNLLYFWAGILSALIVLQSNVFEAAAVALRVTQPYLFVIS